MVMIMATIAKSNIISFGSFLSLYVAYRAAWDAGVFEFLYVFVVYTFALPDLIDACFLIFLGSVLLSGLVFGLFSFTEVVEKGRIVLETGGIDEDRLTAPARKEIDKILNKSASTLNQGAAQYQQILEQAKTAGAYSLRVNLKRMQIDKTFRSAVVNSLLWASLSIATVLCLGYFLEEAAPLGELWPEFLIMFQGRFSPRKSLIISIESIALITTIFFLFRSIAFLTINPIRPIRRKSNDGEKAKVVPIRRIEQFEAALQNKDFKIKFSQTYRALIVVIAIVLAVYYTIPRFFVRIQEIYPILTAVGGEGVSSTQIWGLSIEILAIIVVVYLAIKLIRQYFTPEKFSVFAIQKPAQPATIIEQSKQEEFPSAELLFKTVIAKYRPKTTVAAFNKVKKAEVATIRLPRAMHLSPKNLLSFTDGGKVLFFLAVAIMLFGGSYLNQYRPLDLTVPFYHRLLTFSFIAGVCGALALLTNSDFFHGMFISISPMIGVFVAVLFWYGKSSPFFIAEALLTHAIHFMLVAYYMAARKTVSPKDITISSAVWLIYSVVLFRLMPEFKMIYIYGLLPTLVLIIISGGLMAALMHFIHKPCAGGKIQ
jgi:hypothetical protein